MTCAAPISWRYPGIELLTGLLFAAVAWHTGATPMLPLLFAFAAALIAAGTIDFDHRIIPNEISLPGILVGFGFSFLAREGFWVESLIGLGVGGGGPLLLSLAYSLIRGREGMGMGDVKLLAMLGAWLGWQCLLFVLLFASVQGVLAAVVMWISGVELKPPLPEEWEEEQQDDRPDEDPEPATGFMVAAIPFGPFLALSAVEYLFLAEWFYGLIRRV